MESLLERTLQKTRGNRQEAARLLGLHPTYFSHLCRRLYVKHTPTSQSAENKQLAFYLMLGRPFALTQREHFHRKEVKIRKTIQTNATLSATGQEAVLAAVGTIRQKLPFLIDLSPAERQTTLKLGDKTHGFAKKAFEIAAQNPGILPASVSVDELRNRENLYENLAAIKVAIDQLQKQVDDTTLQVGSDAYATARSIYACTKNGFASGSLQTATDELRKRFGRKNRNATPATPPETPEAAAPPATPSS